MNIGGTNNLVDLNQSARQASRRPHQIYQSSFENAISHLSQRIVGREREIRLMLHTFFAEGHVLFEGRSGGGKTTLSEAHAQAFGLSSSRIQGQPDLLPQQIIGYERPSDEGDDVLVKKNIFHNVVHIDEINRATPEAQSAFLEAMSSGYVSIGSHTIELPDPFFVVATQNSLSLEPGTFPLPFAQLDRFMVRIVPTPYGIKDLNAIGRLYLNKDNNRVKFAPQTLDDHENVKELISIRRAVVVSDEIIDWISSSLVKLDAHSNDSLERVKKLLSPGQPEMVRSLQSLLSLAQSNALYEGRTSVEKTDVNQFLEYVLLHRLILSRQGEASVKSGKSSDAIKLELVNEAFSDS